MKTRKGLIAIGVLSLLWTVILIIPFVNDILLIIQYYAQYQTITVSVYSLIQTPLFSLLLIVCGIIAILAAKRSSLVKPCFISSILLLFSFTINLLLVNMLYGFNTAYFGSMIVPVLYFIVTFTYYRMSTSTRK